LLAGALLLGVCEAALAQELESTCVTCHEDEEAGLPERIRVEQGEVVWVELELALPVAEWRPSIHAAHEVSCDACHGGDPFEPDEDLSMSEEAGFLELPGWRDMTEHCGVCHEDIAERFERGRLGRALEAGERVATCDTCHMYRGHYIVEASPEEILVHERCPSCLGAVDPGAALATLHSLRTREREVEQRADAAERAGIELGDLRQELSGLSTHFSETLHEFDDDALKRASAAAHARLEALDELAARFEDQARRRRRYGTFVVAALGSILLGLLGYRNGDSGRPTS
jgi:hypothetical protein